MIEEQYISFETAKLAAEKGAEKDLWSNQRYTSEGKGVCPYIGINHADEGTYLYVTQSLLARWLRVCKNTSVEIVRKHHGYVFYLCRNDNGETIENESVLYDTYEEAMEEGLQEALKIIGSEAENG